jgi:hypothetical protein
MVFAIVSIVIFVNPRDCRESRSSLAINDGADHGARDLRRMLIYKLTSLGRSRGMRLNFRI